MEEVEMGGLHVEGGDGRGCLEDVDNVERDCMHLQILQLNKFFGDLHKIR